MPMKNRNQYYGASHPLEVNQVTRDPEPRPVPHSKQAIKILERFQAVSGLKCDIRYPTKGHQK